jgi:DNA-binding NarL/FixJ family response regulator
MGAATTEGKLRDYLARFTELPAVYRELVPHRRVPALLARGADLASETCGFERAIVLAIESGTLDAGATEALANSASDKLRRQALARPIRVTRDTAEGKLIRHANGNASSRASTTSALQTALGLGQFAIGVIAPESRALALLVLDRENPPVDELDQALVDAFASVLSVALAQAVLHARVTELSGQLRSLSVSTQALMTELLEAPMTLPRDGRYASAFPHLEAIDSDAPAPNPLRELLSEREITIAALIAEGRSNREIAAQLIVSSETVKAHVARILRKLNASNRAEAVSHYMRLSQPPPT